ncbi:MAG: riboflavin synthase [Campylobacter sp.]|uniref:riboflavin synthase n=1 Tax=Campylobacter sp. TaxID=205 RepID=UPI001B288E88|nr:riboflavin synthase [Campylobacter sp.]MBO5063087.1 riboflavin synthase [Campylobacter sp.]
MFNGLIREIGEVKSFDGKILIIKASHKPNLGDSIAVNGACLSVVAIHSDGFSVELSSESSKVLALENYKDRVHIEPAMRIGDRIDGHLMQGHIDAIGVIKSIKKLSTGFDFFIELPSDILHFVANKGSIGVEGVSLTVNEINGNLMRLTLIPISMKDTLFGEFKVGRRVHIESDILARYIDRILKSNEQTLTWQKADFYASIY